MVHDAGLLARVQTNQPNICPPYPIIHVATNKSSKRLRVNKDFAAPYAPKGSLAE